MNTLPFFELMIGILFGLVVAMIILLLLQVRSNRHISQLTFPAYEYVIKRTEHEADEIIKKAQAEARSIITAAETEARTQAARHVVEIKEAEAMYATELKQYYAEAASAITKNQTEGIATIQALQNDIAVAIKSQESNLRTAADRAKTAWDHITTQLAAVAQTQTEAITTDLQTLSKDLVNSVNSAKAAHAQAISDQISASMSRIESELVAYQKGRQAVLDEHIEKLVESVTAEVLHHSLTSADHAALARASLNSARAKHLI
ncbi:hypothetical protein K2Q16_03000 [Patescibacteria group bacterium]|nr:hypothetical protein [Patescibacteria group bacterium]